VPKPVPETVDIPTFSSPVRETQEVQKWSNFLIVPLKRVFQQIGFRLNGSIHKDGEIGMDAPLVLKSYVIADLPDAADWEGGIVYVSDGAAGENFRGSIGTGWVNLG